LRARTARAPSASVSTPRSRSCSPTTQVSGWVRAYLDELEEREDWAAQLATLADPCDAQNLARLVEPTDPDRAAEAFERAVVLDDGPASLTAAGAFFRRRRAYPRARALLQRSLRVDPSPATNAAGFIAMAALLRAEKTPAGALELGNAVLAERPSDPFARNVVGAACVDLGQYADAEEHFAAAAGARPGERSTCEELRRLADRYREAGDAEGSTRRRPPGAPLLNPTGALPASDAPRSSRCRIIGAWAPSVRRPRRTR
jgi:tetratricopeptide (TPR) repeat protein